MKQKRGAALVEFALVLPVLMLILLGILEFGLILSDQLLLQQGAREGARTAAIGRPVDQVKGETARASLPAVRPEMVQVEFQDAGGNWQPVSNTIDAAGSSVNAAPTRVMVRVTIQGYRHPLVTGSFFSWLPGFQDGRIAMHAAMVMRRE